jgi:radical SAM superfamily enzyme YgiQ (UPF0313 family)
VKIPNVLMVFPRFNPNSFWSLQAACDIWGARCPAPPLGLITVAALLPRQWNVKLVDRNAEILSAADVAWADMIMTGGMLPQRLDALAIIELCQSQGKPVVVGGPDATSSPESYAHADFLVLGEAEESLGFFIDAWRAGVRSGRFEAEKFKVDVTSSPTPRFDLLNFKHYLYVGVQFSRGCPFKCEFCDIIELYGRIPRSKASNQMLDELQTLYDMGYRGHVDFVDDNLIGNKKNLKTFLPALVAWQEARGYPFQFSTEASINLADEPELLDMMSRANFFALFVGIESPDPATLLSAQKKQNTERDLSESIHKIYAAGMFVTAGFIVGFDTEATTPEGIPQAMIDCIDSAGIPVAMVGLLTALPNTQLARRLKAEGRLLPIAPNWGNVAGDQCSAGLNFITLRPRQEVLRDYKEIIESVYSPEAYFGRVRAVGRVLRPPKLPIKIEPRILLHDLGLLFRLMWRLTVRTPELRRHFWRTIADVAWRNPRALEYVVLLIVLYLHLGPFSRNLIRDLDQQIAALDHASVAA